MVPDVASCLARPQAFAFRDPSTRSLAFQYGQAFPRMLPSVRMTRGYRGPGKPRPLWGVSCAVRCNSLNDLMLMHHDFSLRFACSMIWAASMI